MPYNSTYVSRAPYLQISISLNKQNLLSHKEEKTNPYFQKNNRRNQKSPHKNDPIPRREKAVGPMDSRHKHSEGSLARKTSGYSWLHPHPPSAEDSFIFFESRGFLPCPRDIQVRYRGRMLFTARHLSIISFASGYLQRLEDEGTFSFLEFLTYLLFLNKYYFRFIILMT